MARKTNAVLKNGNRDFNNVIDSMIPNLIMKEAGLDSSSGPGKYSLPECLALGLNPTWNLNFGGATLGQNLVDVATSTLDVLTPANVMLRLSLSLARFASQGTAVTAAQASQIFGADANAGALINMSTAAVTTNIIPATLTVNTVSGTTAANLALNDSATDLASAGDQSLVLFDNYVLENGHTLTIGMNAANEMDAESSEWVVTNTAGKNDLEREAATTDLHQDIIFTATSDTTILPGSFLYFHAGNNTDVMTVKSCIRTTGGTIAVTTAN